MKQDELAAVYSALADMWETAIEQRDVNTEIVLGRIDELLYSIDVERRKVGGPQ
jgi:hypothetical protein